MIEDNKALHHLQAYFMNSEMLLCNESKDMPSLSSVGGDWNSIVILMERGEVFYSKFYKGRVTYLSRAFYYQAKTGRQRAENLSPKSREIFDFISVMGGANTADIKKTFMLTAKEYTKHMDELFRELFITVIKRDKTMNDNWSSFYWGSYTQWERLNPS